MAPIDGEPVQRRGTTEDRARLATDGLPRPGQVLAGKYVLRECIGKGGMGLVFLADQPALARTVAVKILHPGLATNEALVRRFHNEAVAACRVPRPGVVAIFDCGVTPEGTPFIAMEHVPGRLLGRVIAEDEIATPRALDLVGQILRTLEAVHAHGVIHADVKSDNILVERTTDGEAITLIDFGLARIDDEWQGGMVSGTPEYMAPELVRGEPPTIASDLYGAGVILYELLTGRVPFEGRSTDEVLTRQLEDEAVPPSLRRPEHEIPAALDQIVRRALAKDPRARFASAGELALALAAVPCGLAGDARRQEAARSPSRGDARTLQLGAAICELREGLDLIAASRAPGVPEATEASDRLAGALAVLYELAGEDRSARRVLATTDRHATIPERDALPGRAEPPTIPDLPHALDSPRRGVPAERDDEARAHPSAA